MCSARWLHVAWTRVRVGGTIALLVNLFKCRPITCVPQRQIRATQRRLNYNAVIYNDDRSAMYNVNMLVDLLCALAFPPQRREN